MERTRRKKSVVRFLKTLLFAGIVLLVFLLGKIPAVAEYVFARGITRGASWLLSRITNFIPVSFYEWTALALIFFAAGFVIRLIVWLVRRRFSRAGIALYRLVVAALCVLLAFGILYAPLYQRQSVSDVLGLYETEMTEEKVFAAAEYYVERLNETSRELERDEAGNILPAESFEKVAEIIGTEFSRVNDGYFAEYEVRPKKVLLSEAMSYLGITGIYFPFYAEANINTVVPSCELPVTIAHEMAHAKGVSRENEANIAAYVLCIRSDNLYLNYSGLMNAVSVLFGALDEEDSAEIYETISPEVLREYSNVNAHYRKYEGPIDRISAFFNNLFLKANGVSGGTKSYGETATGLVALYETLQ